MGHFVVDEKRGRRETRDMILAMGKYGNHNKHFERPFDTDDDVIAYLQEEGFDFNRLVEACRHRDEHVPRVENLITSEWTGGAPPVATSWSTTRGETSFPASPTGARAR